MTWNNRIFRHRYEAKPGEWHDFYEVHEVYYDEEGKVFSHTDNPVSPHGDTVDELIEHIEQILNDVKRSKDDIIEYKEDEEEPNENKTEKQD